MRKTGARMGLKGLLAVMVALVWVWPGSLWGQGTQSQSRYGDSPHQADKSFTTDQQKKRRQQLRQKVQKRRTQKKERRQKAGPASQAPPPSKLMRGAPVGPAGK